MIEQARRIAVIGGSRIPFCRSNTVYSSKSNMDLLSAALQGLIDRFDLHGKQFDEVIAGAVTTHSRDWNLAREALQSIAESSDKSIRIEVRLGHAYSTILKEAEAMNADLIILASHKPGLKDYFLGSNTSKVVNHADCSVVVVR
jgi:nucleotide-binding universal stress UspA family protein